MGSSSWRFPDISSADYYYDTPHSLSSSSLVIFFLTLSTLLLAGLLAFIVYYVTTAAGRSIRDRNQAPLAALPFPFGILGMKGGTKVTEEGIGMFVVIATTLTNVVRLRIDLMNKVMNLEAYENKDKVFLNLQFSDVLEVQRVSGSSKSIKLVYTADDAFSGHESIYLNFATTHAYQQLVDLLTYILNTPDKISFNDDSIIPRPQKVSIRILTWNMGNTKPPPFNQWLPFYTQILQSSAQPYVEPELKDKIQQELAKTPDIIVLAFQEIPNSTANEASRNLICKDFEKYDMIMVASKVSWDRFLGIFIKKKLHVAVSGIHIDTIYFGVGGVAANKGAIIIKFALYDTQFCFINSHLAAHQEMVAKRNKDYSTVVQNIRDSQYQDLLSTLFHHVYWCGDLNYRIDLPRDECVRLIEKKDWKTLYKHDQLRKEMTKNQAFFDFKEIVPKFEPTYRYTRGTCKYNPTKGRIPAWCDRILHKSLDCVESRSHAMFPLMHVDTSDHKPLVGIYEADLVNTEALNIRGFLKPHFVAQHYSLVMTKLLAYDLPKLDLISGSIDPYCIIYSSLFFEEQYRTRTIPSCLSPIWNCEEIPHMPMKGTNLTNLGKKYFVITVFDEDLMKADDIAGSAIINLGPDLKVNERRSFNKAITYRGLPTGRIEGSFMVVPAKEDYDDQPKSLFTKQSFFNLTAPRTSLPILPEFDETAPNRDDGTFGKKKSSAKKDNDFWDDDDDESFGNGLTAEEAVASLNEVLH